MITNTKSKEEFNVQIQENLTELHNFQNLYNAKLQIFSKCLQNTNDEIQKNMKKEEIDIFMPLLSKSKDNLDFLREQISLTTDALTLLTSIQEASDESTSESSIPKIDKFNKLYSTCKTNFYEHSANDENLILDYLNNSVLSAHISQIQPDYETDVLTLNTQSSNSTESTNDIEITENVGIIKALKTTENGKNKGKSENTEKSPNVENSETSEVSLETRGSEVPRNSCNLDNKKISEPLMNEETTLQNESQAFPKTPYNESLDNTEISILVEAKYPINVEEDNRTLLISEVQNRVVLPYKISELQKTLKHNSEYNSLEDIVTDKYIFPLSNFKNTSTARFKEGFSLMRKKEKSSLFDALDLAFEVTFNSSLNPAIIAACKNLNELDTYLYCLDSNQLDNFNCFNIKYEMLPTKTNKSF